METKEIKRVDIMSAAKLSAAIALVFFVIIGIISAVFAILNYAVMPGYSLFANLGGSILSAVLLVVILAVIGMIVGFILGALYAFIYNLAAGVFGGLKVEVE